jgi:hypothetical protein
MLTLRTLVNPVSLLKKRDQVLRVVWLFCAPEDVVELQIAFMFVMTPSRYFSNVKSFGNHYPVMPTEIDVSSELTPSIFPSNSFPSAKSSL